MTDKTLDTLLRSLDPAAPDPAEADSLSPRARADLESILADGATDETRTATVVPLRRRTRSRVALAGAVVAAAAVGVIVVPSLSGHGHGSAAWSAVPDTMNSAEKKIAVQECRDGQAASMGPVFRARLAAAQPVIAERRGRYWSVLLAKGGFTAECVGDEGRPDGELTSGSISSSLDSPAPRAPGSREIFQEESGALEDPDAGSMSTLYGPAGRDIVSVSYRSGGHGVVQATVANGWFYLMVPDDTRLAVSDGPVKVEVRYADGTTKKVRLTYWG